MSNADFRFITFHNAEDFNSRSKKRAVRSHVVRRAFERRRDTFRNTNAQHLAHARHDTHSQLSPPSDPITALNRDMLDPFESLPVDQSTLQTLLRHPSAQQAVEPIFSISDPYSFHNLRGAYANAFTNSAFSNALMCAIALAKNNYIFAPDVLHYKGEAINHINQQLASSTSHECTIGAILLLVGVEWRTTSTENAQVHLKGIRELLRICDSENRTISTSVRRGIFWQDVNTAIVSGTDRVLDRATFPEFQWGRSTFMVDWALLPSGFASLHHELGPATTEVLQDIYVLQKYSEALTCHKPDLVVIDRMDNMQACIEARLIERLQDSEQSHLKTMVLLAAYLYTYSLFTQIWNGSLIPLHISSRLLLQLQGLAFEALFDTQKSVMLWCIIVAGCLTPKGTTRNGFGLLLQMHFGELMLAPNVHVSWFAVSGKLDQFLWSQANFGSRALAFFEENMVLRAP